MLLTPHFYNILSSARCLAALIINSAIIGGFPAAQAVDLSGNPYIKAAPYHAPPLARQSFAGQAGGSGKAAARPQFTAPGVRYRPARIIDPNKAVNHRQWCQNNHPSYRATDNSYRPFDKSGTLRPARVPCVSPYSRP
ncbi:BA14K family protein [Candidatus Tokpelaia sp.]|uniref:BA14K family protein n=1 Tax=Candidatus Tokpelaia sp. TaxID=2233777 RepID=UPI001238CCFD|nr:BA14K family protein [Candidatus Tokpelaia sp.]KAA6405897.1 hypothetical protein DPQ22_02755 [Candidatus Tokpelaia sp.]